MMNRAMSGPGPNIARRGFTLVELLFVLVIAALVLGLVGTSISRSVSGAEMRVAARKMTAALRYTRTRAILDKGGLVIGLDRDKDALSYVRQDLSDRLFLVNCNFAVLDEAVKRSGFDRIQGVIFDLGLSSHQLDSSGRGFLVYSRRRAHSAL